MRSWETELILGYLEPFGLAEEWLCLWVLELMDQGLTLQESAAFAIEASRLRSAPRH